MPLWTTALKLIPWGDVIEAAPQVVKAARGLFRSSSDQVKKADDASASLMAHALSEPGVALQMALTRMEKIESEQARAAELVATLAEQNAQLIQTVEQLRHRVVRAYRMAGLALVVSVGLLVWTLSH